MGTKNGLGHDIESRGMMRLDAYNNTSDVMSYEHHSARHGEQLPKLPLGHRTWTPVVRCSAA